MNALEIGSKRDRRRNHLSEQIYNRESFLTSLAQNLGRSTPETVERPTWKHQPQWQILKNASQDELVTVFKKQCETIHTDVIETESNQLADVIHERVKSYNGKSISAWKDERFHQYDIFSKTDATIHKWDPRMNDNVAKTESADIGITFCELALAESGTVVLFSNENQGRSVSLLPTTYIALVPKSLIVPRMSQATRKIHLLMKEGGFPATCVNFISGPSNSADIEMKLVVGVHGPIRTTYVVISDL